MLMQTSASSPLCRKRLQPRRLSGICSHANWSREIFWSSLPGKYPEL